MNKLNIDTKKQGDKVTHTEFNEIVTAIKEIQDDAGTLGSLTNVDDTADNLPMDDYVLVRLKDSDAWTLKRMSELGGGASSGSVVKLTFIGSGVMTVAQGTPVTLCYNFTSTLDGEPTGAGVASYTIDGRKVFSGNILQGENTFDVTDYLALGTNTVAVEVTDSYGVARKLTYTIETVAISLSSTFDDSQIFTGNISYKYTPVGAVEKVVHFIVDGTEAGTFTTTATNRQQTYSIPAQEHGAHTLEVYMSANVNGSIIESNHLFYGIACVVEGNMSPVISVSFNRTSAGQYETVQIPYVVYDPAATFTDVFLSVDGETVSSLRVDRTRQLWSYRVNETGHVDLNIRCGSISKTIVLDVTKSVVDAEAETADLELHLTSMGRSNSETNRSEWKYGDISAVMTDFNWSANGWIADGNGNVALRVSGDARVEIPLRVFEKDLRVNGKTIEFEFSTSNVTDYDSVILSCWDNGKGLQITAQRALFVSTQTRVEAQFKEEERVRISFVIEETAENRLIYTYINGIASGVVQYPVNDSFAQVRPAGISIGGEGCTVDIYNIRSYNNNLGEHQVLDNYIADMDDVDKKVSLYVRNQVYDAYGEISYNKVLSQLPCLTIIGELPNYKGDKKTCKMIYEDKQDPSKSFTCDRVSNNVQGTSSQYYPRKNYKWSFKSPIIYTQSGETASKYHLRDGDIAVDCFCVKADFAESSGVHNTGMAKIIDTTLKSLGYLTPAQQADSRVRTTVDGFPIVIFHKETDDSPATFLGKYNFNNDKSTQETFGFAEGCECWEFCNNTSSRVLFRESDYEKRDSDGKPDWMNDFETRYPDDDGLNAEYESGRIPANLKRLTDWIVSTKDDSEKFREECAGYFDVDSLLSYYIITELFAMVDQRAKNMFFATWDGMTWYPIFYDNDTAFGINNEGDIAFGYNVEYHDSIGSQNVFNGADSVLWNNVEAAFPSEIAALYKRIRTENILSYESVIDVTNREQSDRWCEAVYNQDGRFKYIGPLVDGFYDYGTNQYVRTGAYLYAMQGSRAEHRKWWLSNRFRYMDSKYDTGNYVSDFATMRLYTPANWSGVAPDPDFSLTPYADQYLKVKFGSYGTESIRAERGKATLVAATKGHILNDTETIIYGASRLKSLGDLAGKYANTIDVSKAVRLEELIIGSSAEGYQNTNLKSLAIGSNRMLRRVNVENCPNLTQALDVSGCDNIEEIDAGGSAITGVILPSGGSLKRLCLPSTVRSLTIKNQPKLMEEGFQIAGVANLTTLVLENTNIDTFSLLARCFSESVYAIERVRLLDVRGTTNSAGLLAKLIDMGGVDENGNDIANAVVTGRCDVDAVYRVDYDALVRTFPELEVNYKFMCIKFADPEVKRVLVSKIDTNGNGEVDELEATTHGSAVNFSSGFFSGNTKIESFDEFKYFINSDFANDRAFADCTSLKSISLPASITAGKYADFDGCTSLSKIELPDTMNTIGGLAFRNCKALKSIVLPNKLIKIHGNAFQYSGLESIIIPDSVETLNDRVFEDCKSLEKAVCGSGIIEFGMNVFEGCNTMHTIIIKSKIPPVYNYNSMGWNNTASIYVPDESFDTYRVASGWSANNIKQRLRRMSEYIES